MKDEHGQSYFIYIMKKSRHSHGEIAIIKRAIHIKITLKQSKLIKMINLDF